MLGERAQRHIARLLDEAEAALLARDWARLHELAGDVLKLDPENADARTFLSAADSGLGSEVAQATPPATPASISPEVSAFANGRYQVRRFLGEGGKKKVFLAHDSLLDRDVAFALIKSEGLDRVGRERITREAQAMGRLGAHPHIVSVFDLGEHGGQPYIVTELMGGGDVEGLIEKAGGPLPVARALEVAKAVCEGLAFAHARGIVHRDLKPGNVWLTADGTAKIGDFGLAVALDRSRLTQHGMMVGTVSYMPPEQALGGEVTPRSDLYSLGAMLYEMLTGRPPFAGTEPTAVISQHINTPPVAPSWLTEQCPPALEALILGLLAKNPAERPDSAEAVLAALEGIDPEQRSPRHSEGHVLERLAHGVFVGREKELERLRKAFDEAFAGRGSLVMLVGEPGIGKTRTAQELETYARMRGAQVLWGRAHEEAGAPPYWPWIQAGRTWGAANDIATLRPQLESVIAELARLFPELRSQPGVGEPEAVNDPQAAQFRLFDAYATFIRAISARAPLVLVLDDLHWADKPTLLLLQHAARELGRMRVLVIGTYRDTELSRTHPLSEALARLNRDPGFLRLPLRGLSREEVAAYIRASARVDPKSVLVERIFEETEGNPFFLSEVVNLLTQEGTLTDDSVSDIAIPDGVKEALGRRLDRVSEETNALLQVCAIVGREFSYDTLSLLGERDEDELLRLIEEALEARVIEEMAEAGRYRFTHALMQETLLSELSTTRKVRLHGQVAEALERRWGERADDYASRLARHFTESATVSSRHASKAFEYSKRAAQEAEAKLAWDEAARHYGHAATAMASLVEPRKSEEADLFDRMARCWRNAGQWRPAWQCFTRAMEIYREVGERVALATTTLEALAVNMPRARAIALAQGALEFVGDREPHLEARLLVELAHASSDATVVQPALTKAAALAQANAYEDVQARLRGFEANRLVDSGHIEAARQIFGRAHQELARMGRTRDASSASFCYGTLPLFLGRLDEGIREAEQAIVLAQRQRMAQSFENIACAIASVYLARRQLSPFEATLGEVVATGNFWRDLQRVTWAEAEGDLEKARRLLPHHELAGGVASYSTMIQGGRARILFNLGDLDAAAAEFDTWYRMLPSVAAHSFPVTHTRLQAYCELDQCLCGVGDEHLLRLALSELNRWRTVRFAAWSGRSVDRLRGAIALRLGLIDEAHQHYRTGLDWATRERCPIEAGRCLQGLAEIAERRGDHATALKHLERAGELFANVGAKLYLDQVLAKKEILKA